MFTSKQTFTIVACLIGYALMQDSFAAVSDLTRNVENAVSSQDFVTAMDLLNDHLVEYPDDNAARFKRAQVLGWAGDYAGARSEFDSLIAESPGNVDYVFGRVGQPEHLSLLESMLHDLRSGGSGIAPHRLSAHCLSWARTNCGSYKIAGAILSLPTYCSKRMQKSGLHERRTDC